MTTTNKEIRFGVEIETVGGRRSKLVEAVNSVVHGVVTQAFDGYNSVYVTAPDGRAWRLMDDGSLTGRGTSCPGTEIVSPILTHADMDTLQAIVRALRAAGASVDGSCGIHIHVDGTAFKAAPRAIVNITRMWARYEELVGLAIDLLPSRKARFCRPVRADFLDRLDAMKDPTLDALNRAWYGALTPNPRHYHESRYHALNLHAIWNKGTIEFRLFNGTLHAGKIRSYVQLCTSVAAYALNAKTVRRGKRAFDAAWTKNACFYFLKGLGLVGPEYKTARFHLLGLCKGLAGFKSLADYEAWQVRQGRRAAPTNISESHSAAAVSGAA